MFAVPKFKFAIGLFVFFIAAMCISAQYRFDTWTTDNGLPQNGLRQITQTKDGYLWFTTFDGLVRFDGVRFTTFNKGNTKGIANNRFTSIFASSDDTIYAGTMEDGVLTVRRNGVFQTYPSSVVPGHYVGQFEQSAGGDVRFLSENDDRKGKSWFRLTDGRFEFLEKMIPQETSLRIDIDADRAFEISSEGVTEIRGNDVSFIPLGLGDLADRVNTFVAKNGDLWITENRVHRIRDGVVRTFSKDEGLPLRSLYHSMWETDDGHVWAVSGGASSLSIGVIEIADDDVKIWGADHGFVSSSIHGVYRDTEGQLWLATDRGLVRFRRQVIQTYSTGAGLTHTEVYPMMRDSKGTIWIGTSRGLNVYKDGTFQPYPVKVPIGEPGEGSIMDPHKLSVQSLFEDENGKIWVGVNGGIYVIDDEKTVWLFRHSHVNSIRSDSEGNVWAASNKGLTRFANYEQKQHFTEKDGLPKEFTTIVFLDSKGGLWFGGYGGLTKYENGKFVNFSTKDGLAGNYVRTIYEDADGTFWIGTYDEGLSRFRNGKFDSFRESHGLYNNGVFAIEEDASGYFWISSNRGIYRVAKSDLEAVADGRISKFDSVAYGKDDGMLSNECNGGRQPASLRTDDGKFWFPTQNGISIVDPTAFSINQRPPSVVVEEVTVGREPIDITNGLTIDAGGRDIEIRYTGISLIKSDQIRFQYKLDGHDADWIDAGTRRTAYYSYLAPGNYTFLVKAANSDGVWSPSPALAKFDLKPYFYQTRWFFLFALAFAAFLLLIVWKVSVKQLEAREKRLTHLVNERTMELAMVNETLEALANSDGLTKIGNRRRFESFLADEWHRAIRFKTPISLVMIDIDHFKQYNDTYGHQAGDECLQRVADALAASVNRPTDMVARFGGEEFALVLGGTDAVGAEIIAELAYRNVRELEIPHLTSDTHEHLTVSVGISTSMPAVGDSETDLLNRADRALYLAKKNGRDRIVHYDPADENHRRIHISDSTADTIPPPMPSVPNELPYR